jgi:hypothetical protein
MRKGIPLTIIGSRHLGVPGNFIHFGHKELEFRTHPRLPMLQLDEGIEQLLVKINQQDINEQGNVQLGGGFAKENH